MEFWRGSRTNADPAETPRASGRVAPPTTPFLAQVYAVLRRRRWAVLGIVAAFIVLGIVGTLLMTPKYTASSTIEIQRETRNFTLVRGAEQADAGPADMEFYRTQYGLLRSRALAIKVAEDLRLTDDASFFDTFGGRREKAWFVDGRLAPSAPSRADRARAAGDLLLKNLGVDQERLSRLVTISFVSPDPEFSRKVVAAWGDAFIEQTLERRYQATAYARRFLETRLSQLRGRIDRSERQLVEYASREGIVNIPETTTTGESAGATVERPIVADDLATLNRALASATAERAQAESRLAGGGDTTTEALANQAISGLRERRANLAADYAKLMAQFEPGYPPAVALRDQVGELDRAIAREEQRVSNTLRQAYGASVREQQLLRSRVTELKTGVLDLRRRSIQYNIYQREVDTNRQLYDALLQRYKEIGVAGGVGVNNISIVDPAERPVKPSSPRLLLNLLIAAVLGVIVGGGAAYLLEQIDEVVNDPADVEQMFGQPLLGTTPSIADTPMAALADRKSSLTEAYTSLQTNLGFTTDSGVPRSLSVTSSRPGEGKSTTSFALAQALARAGKRTLLLDGDMRNPSVHHLLDRRNESGLSNILAGAATATIPVVDTGIPNLSAMFAGPQPPSAAELLSSDRFRELLLELRDRFDHVVVDAPPVMGLADAPLIGSTVEGCVFVLESHGTKRALVRTALSRLASANVPVLGIVLTKFETKRASYEYGYDYAYGTAGSARR